MEDFVFSTDDELFNYFQVNIAIVRHRRRHTMKVCEDKPYLVPILLWMVTVASCQINFGPNVQVNQGEFKPQDETTSPNPSTVQEEITDATISPSFIIFDEGLNSNETNRQPSNVKPDDGAGHQGISSGSPTTPSTQAISQTTGSPSPGTQQPSTSTSASSSPTTGPGPTSTTPYSPEKTQQQQQPPSPIRPTCDSINGRPTTCQEYVKCALYQSEYLELRKSRAITNDSTKCQLPDGKDGICCQVVTTNRATDVKTFLQKPPGRPLNLDETRFVGARREENETLAIERSVNQAADEIVSFANQHLILEDHLLSSAGNGTPVIKKGTKSHGHLLFFQTSKKAIELSKFGYNLLQSSKDVSKRLGIQGKGTGEGLQKYNLKKSKEKAKCPAIPTCNDAQHKKYRRIDGSCNNLGNPSLGMSYTPLGRILEPDYADGVWAPRLSKANLPLPSARQLSHAMIYDNDAPDYRYSLFLMQLGQFIDHDLSHVPAYRFLNGSGIECCTEDGTSKLAPNLTHTFCLPIEIPDSDSFFKEYKQRCMNFVRSMVSPRLDCSLGYGDQMNQITHWLDSSNVYGSTEGDERELRLFKDGLLKTGLMPERHISHLKGMLPLQEREGDECTSPDQGRNCFNAGDLRVNEMVGLTATHLIWMREHNRIAVRLKLLNPIWNDNQLYLEAKRILNAEYQHIIYNEWLPILIGRSYMEVYGILPLTTGYSFDYDNTIDPSVSNAFAAAAFRVGHTLIQGILNLVNELGVVEEQIHIHEHFFNPFRIREEGLLDKILRTLTTQPIQSFDNSVTSEVTQRLFQTGTGLPFGMDLIALNIQRGRDHGIPGYNFYRQACKIGRAETFEGFLDWIPSNLVQLLTKYYDHIDDVDLFIGGILEKPLPGALLGPTFTCIIGDQFARAKKADRFAYDLGAQEGSFTPAQLDAIRRVSFARIICDNSDDLRKMQPYAFFVPGGEFNGRVPCDSQLIPSLDLTQWSETVKQ